MPLHRLFVPKGLYTQEDKAAIGKAITNIYTAPPVSLPAFYVVVLFIELEAGNIIVGGEVTERMVRIGVEHIARNFAKCGKSLLRNRNNANCLSVMRKNAGLWTDTSKLWSHSPSTEALTGRFRSPTMT